MRTRMIVTTLTAAAVLSLGACSSDGGKTADAAPPVSPAASAPAAGASSAAPEAPASASATTALPTTPPKPAGTAAAAETAKQLAMVAGLGQIDPKLALDKERSIAAAQRTCGDIHAGKDAATVAKNTAGYFSGAGSTLSEQQGQMIAVIVQASICP
ncbi:DUF732 domain-containing protein [Kitasatospora sp. NBC_01539]|uniref:DUF732 domain-containing protein n=1 Tax=Kitasatospora sp. NBC_01539 TaxID=2903577 RepID=UPI0038600BCC